MADEEREEERERSGEDDSAELGESLEEEGRDLASPTPVADV